jgi:hypothetical protein
MLCVTNYEQEFVEAGILQFPRAGVQSPTQEKAHNRRFFDVGVLPLDATYTNSTSPLACGKDGSGSAGEPHKVLERRGVTGRQWLFRVAISS